MSERSFLYVANWKMKMLHAQAQQFCTQHHNALVEVASVPGTVLAICPSFTEIPLLVQAFASTAVAIGAQDCGPAKTGAYTGQVSAQSLKEIGCSFCIVGHSERRQHCGETDEMVAHKLQAVLEVGLTPIVCIGETEQERDAGRTMKILDQQLAPVTAAMRAANPAKTVWIAYEPVWAIGTGVTPSEAQLKEAFAGIRRLLKQVGVAERCRFMYGGSVNASNASQLRCEAAIEGFLIGGASVDFQELKKVVSSSCTGSVPA